MKTKTCKDYNPVSAHNGLLLRHQIMETHLMMLFLKEIFECFKQFNDICRENFQTICH